MMRNFYLVRWSAVAAAAILCLCHLLFTGSASVDCKVAKTSKGAVGTPELEIEWPGRIVAVGDLHGDAENALLLLDALGVVDRKTRGWKGGDTLLIQTGDIIDRGPDGLILYDLFTQWAAEAHATGGKVLVLLGNHDAMNLCGDFRYAHHKETAQFGGLSRRRAAFSEDGKYGSLLLKLAPAVRINGIVFSHAGVTPPFAALGLLRLRELLSEELRGGCALHYKKHNGEVPEALFATGEEGPLWTRRYTLTPAYVACPALESALGMLEAEVMVVGHTVQESLSVETRCEGKLVAIDTGISRYVANSPRGIEVTCDGSFYEVAIQPGPRDEDDKNNLDFTKRKLNAKAEKHYKRRKSTVTENAWITVAELSGDL